MAEFEDGKDEGALRTIGEVGEALGIKSHVLRYWEQQFSLLKPLKRSGGRRYYRPSDVELVETINRLVNEEGYTLKGAEAVLRAGGKSEFDRRADDRRSSDRRAATDLRRASDDDGSKRSKAEMLEQLRGIRDRLDKALDA
ncbi:MAG: MerR family transcriptional regulator [Pseudomonadota bacterium]